MNAPFASQGRQFVRSPGFARDAYRPTTPLELLDSLMFSAPTANELPETPYPYTEQFARHELLFGRNPAPDYIPYVNDYARPFRFEADGTVSYYETSGTAIGQANFWTYIGPYVSTFMGAPVQIPPPPIGTFYQNPARHLQAERFPGQTSYRINYPKNAVHRVLSGPFGQTVPVVHSTWINGISRFFINFRANGWVGVADLTYKATPNSDGTIGYSEFRITRVRFEENVSLEPFSQTVIQLPLGALQMRFIIMAETPSAWSIRTGIPVVT